jgi:hypothetical protein
MSERDDDERALAALPAETRARLDAFARALERVNVGELSLHVARTRDDDHRRAIETAEIVAIETGLEAAVAAARRTVGELVMRIYAESIYRTSIFGVNTAPTSGPVDDRLQLVRSLGDAVAAIILGPHLDEATQAELLGLWDRLLP